MKSILMISILFLNLSGCQEYSEFIKGSRNITIIPNRTSISSVEVSDWRVGPLRRQEVSKGLRVKLDLPQLEKKHLRDLIKTIGIDSWVIRVKRKTLITSEVIHTFYVPLLVPGRGNSDFRTKQIPAGFLNIYYSAAATSSRFESFQCPAFDHRKVITDFEVIGVVGREKAIRASKTRATLITEKLELYTYKPLPVNAGKRMTGQYHFEIAFYNHKERLRKSNWFELHEAVKVSNEELVTIKGCKDFKIPKYDPKIDNIKDFKFGR